MTEKVNIDKSILRTQNGYNNNIVNIQADPELCLLYGIKSNSHLNFLQYFHVIDVLAADLAHDIFEGIAVDVMDDIIFALIFVSKVFIIDFVNEAIASFKHSKIHKKNKPQPFKIISSVNFKIKQTACENLIRLLPPILVPHITNANIYWDLYIKFCQLVGRLFNLLFNRNDDLVRKY